MCSVTSATNSALHAAIAHDGFAFVHGGAMRDLLAPYGPLADWTAFADSWNHLELDTYMADGGRYRRRRHAVVLGKRRTRRSSAHRISRTFRPSTTTR